MPRAIVEPVREIPKDLLRLMLGDHLYPAVSPVPSFASYPVKLGLSTDEVPKADPLDPSPNDNPYRSHGRVYLRNRIYQLG